MATNRPPRPSPSPKPARWKAELNRARILHQQGRWQEAAPIYAAILAAYPQQFDATHLLGVAHLQAGRPDRAADLLGRAVALRPDAPAPHRDWGNALHALGRLDDALASLDRAIARDPASADTHVNRADILRDLRRPAEALSGYDRALALRSDHGNGLAGRADALATLGREAEALATFDRAIALTPDARHFYNRANAQRSFGRLEAAVADYDRALFRQPTFVDAAANRAATLANLGRRPEALAGYDRVLALRPDMANAHYNRGSVLRDLGRLDEAIASYDRAVALRPDDAEAVRDRGLCKLLAGRLPDGWADHEARWRTAAFRESRPPLAVPHWSGESLAGKAILVYAEQGLGDTIQFVRFLPRLAAEARSVVLQAPASLCRLLRTVSDRVTVVEGANPSWSFDLQCALMSLPARFATGLADIPAHTPYLAADPERIRRWERDVQRQDFAIGIVWQGNPKGTVDRGRSIPLRAFAPLGAIPGVRLVSLQRTHGLDQLAHLPPEMRVEVLDPAFDAGADAFADTAALMTRLDLVVSVDTSVAHLAGALGRPTWVALKRVPDWRWMLDRAETPWYPEMRLFRQDSTERWEPVMADMAAALRQRLAAGTTPA